jgi:hypothetical protein
MVRGSCQSEIEKSPNPAMYQVSCFSALAFESGKKGFNRLRFVAGDAFRS